MTTIIYDETGDNDYRLYEEGSYLGGSLTLDYILLQETSTSSFTQHQASTSLETGVSFASAGNNQNTSQSDASLQSVLFPGNLLANVDVESEGSTESAAFDSGETYGYVRSSSSVADRSGASSYTLLEEGSFAGTLSLDWIVLDRQSTSSYASLGTTVEMRSSAAENSHTFGSGLSETLASFAPGAGTYSYAGAENQGWNTSSASSFSSTSTSTYQDVGTSSYTLRQEGDYDGGSLSLSCYVLSQGSASSSTRHQEMSRTDSSTTSRERTTGGTETAMFDEGGTFHVSIGTYSATISETFTFDSTSSSSHDSGSTSSMSLYQLGSFSGGSFSLVSISYREGSQGSYSSHEGSAWSYGGDAVGGGHSSQDQASASSMSWLAAGSFANGDVNLSCFAYDTGSQSSFTSHGEGTFATGSTGESYVQDSTSASSMSLHERGIYGGGSFSLSSYALQQGGTSSYTMHSASSFTSASDSNSSTRDAISRGSFSLSAVGSYALGSFQFSSYLRNEASLSSYAMHAEGLHTTSDGTTSFVQDGLSVESLLLHENGSYAGGVLSLSSYSYVTGSLESLGWHETVQNSAFTRTRSDGLIEAAERAEVGSFSLGSSAWSETGTQSSNIQVSVGTFIWNSPSLDSYSRSGGGTFTLKREVQGTQLFTEIPTGLTTPERVSDLQQKAQELTNGIDANGLVQRLQGEMGFLMEEARRAAGTAVNVIDLNGAKPVIGLTSVSLVRGELVMDAETLTRWGEGVRTEDIALTIVRPEMAIEGLVGLGGLFPYHAPLTTHHAPTDLESLFLAHHAGQSGSEMGGAPGAPNMPEDPGDGERYAMVPVRGFTAGSGQPGTAPGAPASGEQRGMNAPAGGEFFGGRQRRQQRQQERRQERWGTSDPVPYPPCDCPQPVPVVPRVPQTAEPPLAKDSAKNAPKAIPAPKPDDQMPVTEKERARTRIILLLVDTKRVNKSDPLQQRADKAIDQLSKKDREALFDLLGKDDTAHQGLRDYLKGRAKETDDAKHLKEEIEKYLEMYQEDQNELRRLELFEETERVRKIEEAAKRLQEQLEKDAKEAQDYQTKRAQWDSELQAWKGKADAKWKAAKDWIDNDYANRMKWNKIYDAQLQPLWKNQGWGSPSKEQVRLTRLWVSTATENSRLFSVNASGDVTPLDKAGKDIWKYYDEAMANTTLSVSQRFEKVLKLAVPKTTGALHERLTKLTEPDNLKIMAAIIGGFAVGSFTAHLFGVGWFADAVIGAFGWCVFGSSVISITRDLV